jgi:2-polyprenyl-3-methyl-5-hydroxy-6-metoxy-1,4-benzoquinol methylase
MLHAPGINPVDQSQTSKPRTSRGHYDSNYNNFQSKLYEQVRRDAFGEDIGQNSWLTASEQDKFQNWLSLGPGKRLLDAACGAGGPALRLAALTGASVMGIDVHEQAVVTANALAAQRGLAGRCEFRVMDATQALPLSDASFDAITCIDAINHLPDRRRVIAEWARLMKPEGRLLFTDPIVITGPLSNAEIAIRSSAGFYLLVPQGYDEQVLVQCGLRLVTVENRTKNMAEIAHRRRQARESHAQALQEIEGPQEYEAQQQFLTVASRVAQEGRLSRFLFVAEKVVALQR